MRNLFLVLIIFLNTPSWADDFEAKKSIQKKFNTLSEQQYQQAVANNAKDPDLHTIIHLDIFTNQLTYEERYLYTRHLPLKVFNLIASAHRRDPYGAGELQDLLNTIDFQTELPKGGIFSDKVFQGQHSVVKYLLKNEYLDLSMMSETRLEKTLRSIFKNRNDWDIHMYGDELKEHGYNEFNYKTRSNNQPNNQVILNYDHLPDEIQSCVYDSENNAHEPFVNRTANDMIEYLSRLNQGQQFNVFSELNPAQDCHIYITITTEVDDSNKVKITSLTGEINYYPKAMTVQISYDDILKLTGLGELL